MKCRVGDTYTIAALIYSDTARTDMFDDTASDADIACRLQFPSRCDWALAIARVVETAL